MKLTTRSALKWAPCEPPGWYSCDTEHFSATIDTDRRKVTVFLADPDDLSELSALTASLGLPFPSSVADLFTVIAGVRAWPWVLTVLENGVYQVEADF
jgi:hypothetical protein